MEDRLVGDGGLPRRRRALGPGELERAVLRQPRPDGGDVLPERRRQVELLEAERRQLAQSLLGGAGTRQREHAEVRQAGVHDVQPGTR